MPLCKEKVKRVKPRLGSDSPPSGWQWEWWECQGSPCILWLPSPHNLALQRWGYTDVCTHVMCGLTAVLKRIRFKLLTHDLRFIKRQHWARLERHPYDLKPAASSHFLMTGL